MLLKKAIIVLGTIVAHATQIQAVKNPRQCKNNGSGVAVKVRIYCTKPNGSSCSSLDTDKPFEFRTNQATCQTRSLTIRYKMINPNDFTVRVNKNTELLFNGASIFDNGDVREVIGVKIQPKQATERTFKAIIDTCENQELSASISLKFKTMDDEKRYGGCNTESKSIVEYFEKDVLDSSASPSESFSPSVSDTPSFSPSVSVTPSFSPSVSVTPSFSPSVSVTPSSSPPVIVEKDFDSDVTQVPSETTHPSISPAAPSAKGPSKQECKKKRKIKVPLRCKGVDRDPDDQIYRPRKDIASEDNASQCRSAYAASGFTLFDTLNYDRWYDAESLLVVSDLGMFKGDDGIAQYVNFLQNKDILDKFELAETSSSVLEIIAEDDECVLTVAYVASVATNAANSNDKLSVTMDVVVGLRTKFSTIDAATIRVHRNDLYFPQDFSSFFWGDALRSRKIAEGNCSVMRDSCQNIYEDNCYTEFDDCVMDMLALPGTGRRGNADGKSMACRTFYANAISDLNQCQNISYEPKFDIQCQLKCQRSAHLKNKDLFIPEERKFFTEFSNQVGLGDDKWISPGTRSSRVRSV